MRHGKFRKGFDPSGIVRKEKQQICSNAENTFGAIAEELFEKIEKEGKAPTTLANKRWTPSPYSISLDNRLTFGLRGVLISPVVSRRAAPTNGEDFAGLIHAVWNYDGAHILVNCA